MEVWEWSSLTLYSDLFNYRIAKHLAMIVRNQLSKHNAVHGFVVSIKQDNKNSILLSNSIQTQEREDPNAKSNT